MLLPNRLGVVTEEEGTLLVVVVVVAAFDGLLTRKENAGFGAAEESAEGLQIFDYGVY